MLLRVTFEVGGICKAVFNFIFSSFLAMVSVEAGGLKFATTISFVSLKFKEIIIALSCCCYCDMYIHLSEKKGCDFNCTSSKIYGWWPLDLHAPVI